MQRHMIAISENRISSGPTDLTRPDPVRIVDPVLRFQLRVINRAHYAAKSQLSESSEVMSEQCSLDGDRKQYNGTARQEQLNKVECVYLRSPYSQ